MAATEVAVQGATLAYSTGGAPTTIVNVDSLTVPFKARTVDTSNISDAWMRQITTLLETGNATFNIFYVMTDPTHDLATGLLGFFVNKTLVTWTLTYNDGHASNVQWTGYVSSFQDAGKTADVWRASITIAGTGTPTFSV